MLFAAYNPNKKIYIGPDWFEQTEDIEYAKTWHTEKSCQRLLDNMAHLEKYQGFKVITVTIIQK